QEVPTSSTSADRGAVFTSQSNTFYTSFLLNYQDNGGAVYDRVIYNVVTGASTNINAGSFSSVYFAAWLTPDYRIKITKNFRGAANFSAATPVLTKNVPHLIVMRYLKVPGGIDEADLWVDPTPFGDNASIPPPTISTTNAPNVAFFNGVVLNNRKIFASYSLNVFQVDEIRFDSTWSGVTPTATPAPGPLFGVTGGGTGCPGDLFPINLSGSVTTNNYLLYTNNVYAGVTLTGTGSALNFGLYATIADYSILASNSVTGNFGWMSNSVSVYVLAPVNIVTEPSPAVTATNSRAQFIVSATGDQLGYQWYKDGNPLTDDSHLTGSTSNMLVIWPATTGDIGNYYCSVTNPCSVSITYSTTNSLTLDAPNNLVWAGNAFNQEWWDISTSFNWNSGAAIFNEGDNVTFDDSYPGGSYGQVITLFGTLTPMFMTYSTSQPLTWAGSGTLAGSGELLVTGAGRLTISNTVGAGVFAANSYTGGTVISNGTVYIQNWNSLGTGPITLAGGTLESKLKGNGGTGLSNNISVTANSTWLTDQSGQQSASLLGTLIGNPGTTLTFTNSTTATNGQNWIYLNAPFTNSSAIILSELETNSSVTGMRLVFNNSTGDQIYNGTISEAAPGLGGVIEQGSGAVYLNTANTYTGPTAVNAGLLAGSGSITSPLTVTNGSLGGGSANAIGTFTVNGNVSFLNGNVYIRVNKSLAQSNDIISVTGIITNGGTGTVTITNSGATPLAVGDRFKIFSGPVENGAALAVTGGGVTWANNLAVDGSVQVSLGFVVLTNSPLITSFSPQGANAVINGTNGQAGATAYLLMTTNIAQPPNQWKTVATNVLGGSAYTFVGTNVITTSSPQQFFMLSSTNYNP
ncbi:MAG TPA: immunoglobulin domain-containing protein, partial [Verrucomicrobiae bacterium]|nr:immunoglobulin domain-containing protein [Verrucomicrobiae bacterium]